MKLAMDVVVVAVSVVMKTIFAKFCAVFVIVLKLYLYVYAVVAVMNRVVMNLNAKIVVLLAALIIVCVVIANTMKNIMIKIVNFFVIVIRHKEKAFGVINFLQIKHKKKFFLFN